MIVLRILFYSMIFLVTLVYFLPVNQFVGYANTIVLPQYQIDIKADFENNLLSHISNNSKIDYKKQRVANIDLFKLEPYIFYNKVTLSKVELQGMAGSIFPSKIENVDLIYSVLSPSKLDINITGQFGSANGNFDIFTGKLYLEISPSNILKTNYSFVLKYMKQVNKKYIYEYKL